MLSREELERYARQLVLFGEEGQLRLKNAKVFIAGAGGLGCPVALYLAVAGVGSIRIVDNDKVELSNLNRQILHFESDIGKEKALSVREKLSALNSNIKVEAFCYSIDGENIDELVGDADLLVDAVDNYQTRYLLNAVAIRKDIPLVHGAIRAYDGQVMTMIPGRTACLNCIFPDVPGECPPPVLGMTAGIVGVVQANEVIKYLTGKGELLTNRLLIWNGLTSEMDIVKIGKRHDCEVCSLKG